MRQLTVAEDAGIGIVAGEILQQLVEGVFLGVGTGVGSNALLIQAALINDTQTTVVVVSGMDALDALGQQRNNISVTTDIVVVTTLTIFGHAAGYQVLHAEGTVAFVGHAVDDEQLHGVMFQWFHNELFRVAALKRRKDNLLELRRYPSEERSSGQRWCRRC